MREQSFCPRLPCRVEAFDLHQAPCPGSCTPIPNRESTRYSSGEPKIRRPFLCLAHKPERQNSGSAPGWWLPTKPVVYMTLKRTIQTPIKAKLAARGVHTGKRTRAARASTGPIESADRQIKRRNAEKLVIERWRSEPPQKPIKAEYCRAIERAKHDLAESSCVATWPGR